MKILDLEQEILRQQSFIEEEQRCLDYCLDNQQECDENEIEEREEYIRELIEHLEYNKSFSLNNF